MELHSEAQKWAHLVASLGDRTFPAWFGTFPHLRWEARVGNTSQADDAQTSMSPECPVTNTRLLSSTQPLVKPALATLKISGWKHFRGATDLLLMLLLAFGSYWCVSRFLVQSVKVVGGSMVPTLHDSDRYLLNRWVFLVRAPHPSDIVVIRDPSDNGFSVKRIIAVAGDTVFLKDGKVLVNGRELQESYLRPGTETFAYSPTSQSFHCGSGQYFVLGDNRGNSIDSRAYGPVSRASILGLIIR